MSLSQPKLRAGKGVTRLSSLSWTRGPRQTGVRQQPPQFGVCSALSSSKSHGAKAGDSKKQSNQEHLHLPLFHRVDNLPVEGHLLTPQEEQCDPYVQLCKSPLYVYETKCTTCYGTGSVKRPANGRHAQLSTCLACVGLGYVRRVQADPPSSAAQANFTLLRPRSPRPVPPAIDHDADEFWTDEEGEGVWEHAVRHAKVRPVVDLHKPSHVHMQYPMDSDNEEVREDAYQPPVEAVPNTTDEDEP